MSKSTKQSLSLLAAVGGGLKAVADGRTLGPEMSGLIADARKVIGDTINAWPITGNEQAHYHALTVTMSDWHERLARIPGHSGAWTIATCVGVSMHILDDMLGRVSNGWKRDRLQACLDAVLRIDDWMTRDTTTPFESYEVAGIIVNELYKTVGFEA